VLTEIKKSARFFIISANRGCTKTQHNIKLQKIYFIKQLLESRTSLSLIHLMSTFNCRLKTVFADDVATVFHGHIHILGPFHILLLMHAQFKTLHKVLNHSKINCLAYKDESLNNAITEVKQSIALSRDDDNELQIICALVIYMVKL
jgi:hypothetical protein